MKHSPAHQKKRDRTKVYFDRTAAEQWAKLTSDRPVPCIRKTVREASHRVRQVLLSWLLNDHSDRRIRDPGCSTCVLTFTLAAYAINATQFILKLRAARLQSAQQNTQQVTA